MICLQHKAIVDINEKLSSSRPAVVLLFLRCPAAVLQMSCSCRVALAIVVAAIVLQFSCKFLQVSCIFPASVLQFPCNFLPSFLQSSCNCPAIVLQFSCSFPAVFLLFSCSLPAVFLKMSFSSFLAVFLHLNRKECLHNVPA